MKKTRMIALFILAAAWPAVGGEEDVAWLDPVVVIARGRETRLTLTPGSVALLPEEAFEARRVAGIGDLAGLVPGVARTGDGPWGAEWNIRGLSRKSVILLIDGLRVNTATDLAARFGQVPPEAVRDVEVMKGPVSALYGSGALGGVVNIRTRGGEFSAEPVRETRISGAGGSNPAGATAMASFRDESPDRYLYLAQAFRDYGEYRDGDGDRVVNSQYRDAFTLLKAGRRLAPEWSLHAGFQLSFGDDIGVPGSGTATLPPAVRVTYEDVIRTLSSLAVEFAPETGSLQRSRLDVYHQYIRRDVRIDRFPPAAPVARLEPSGVHHTVGAQWRNEHEDGRHAWTWGLDAWQWNFRSERIRHFRDGRSRREEPLPEARFLSYGVFAEDEVALGGDTRLLLGGRLDGIQVRNDANADWDKSRETDTVGSAHAGFVVPIGPQLFWRTTVAAGYRAADLSERFQFLDLGGGVVKVGDPELDPERSHMAETGLEFRGERWSAGASVFVNDLRDLIAEERADEFTIVNRNIARARYQGAEAEFRWLPRARTRLYGNLAYVEGEDRRTGEDLPGLAPLGGLLGMRQGLANGYWVGIEGEFAARQNRTPPGVDSADGWVVINARAGRRMERGSTAHAFHIGVDNLFNETYRNYLTTWRGNTFNEPGFQVTAGYDIRF